MHMLMSQILKSIDFTETQKPEYLENKTFFLQIKKTINYKSRDYFMAKKYYCSRGSL